MNISVIGAGHVGLVTGACLAEIGHRVICVDNDPARISLLKKGKMPFHEPGLLDLVQSNLKRKRLFFSTAISSSVARSEVVFIAVGTPTRSNGAADLSQVKKVGTQIARALKKYCLIVEKSTVPVETGTWLKQIIQKNISKKIDFDVASNPEFLREGSAVQDFMKPNRVVIGVSGKRAEKILRELYEPLKCRLVVTNINSAEIIKHASNSFLAAKISFINMIAQLCEKAGADVKEVAAGMGYDHRINPYFLEAGIGFGGFCFPKDLAAFIHIGEKNSVDFSMLKSVLEINEEQKRIFTDKVKRRLKNLKGKKIAVWGLSFKPDTDDMRFAPSLDVIRALKSEGALISAYDPTAMREAKSLLKGIHYARDIYETVRDAHALLLVTEWKEFLNADFRKVKNLMKNPLIFDGRNALDEAALRKLHFHYLPVGRPGF